MLITKYECRQTAPISVYGSRFIQRSLCIIPLPKVPCTTFIPPIFPISKMPVARNPY
jgi:hypothetical protein